MKKLIFLLFTFAFSFEITTTKTFEQTYTPRNFILNGNLIIITKNFSNLFNKISKIKNNQYCKLKNYFITPIFDKRSNFLKYQTTANFSCNINLQNYSKIENFLNFLSTEGKVRIYSLHPYTKFFSKELKTQAYKYGINFAKNISKKLNINCYVKNIHFSSQLPFKCKTFKNSLPNEEIKNKLSVEYIIECLE